LAKKKKEESVLPKLSNLIGKKLIDVSRDNGSTVFHFSNSFNVILSGYSSIKIEEEQNV
jgi:hypothetical protein